MKKAKSYDPGILARLASSQHRSDQLPNQELARSIAKKNDEEAVVELISLLKKGPARVSGDCIKVLYEIGELKPDLISPYLSTFIELLKSKNNRLVWGAMSAVDCIAGVEPQKVHRHLVTILKVMDDGTVITRDHGVNILVKIGSIKSLRDDCLDLLSAIMKESPVNQFPMYAEKSMNLISPARKKEFVSVFESRIEEMNTESKKKRLQKLIKQLSK